MKEAIILTHHDADGILSARLMSKAVPNAVVKFQDWTSFGVWDKDVPMLREYESVFILDLGSQKTTMDALVKVSEKSSVYLLDHHPSDIAPDEHANKKLTIIHDKDNCTAGIAYNFAKDILPGDDPWLLTWAAIGTISDVADKTPGGKIIMELVKKNVPELLWNDVYWTGKGELKLTLASVYGAYLNATRRVAYSKGPVLAIGALKEIEDYGSLNLLYDPLQKPMDRPMHLDVDYPNTALLRYWRWRWIEDRKKSLDTEHCHTFDLGDFTVAITNHPWDVAAYIAGVKSHDKPCIAINYGVPNETYANLSGRSGGRSEIDLSLVMETATEMSSGQVKGAGHPVAVGGLVSRALRVEDVIKVLQKAFTMIVELK